MKSSRPHNIKIHNLNLLKLILKENGPLSQRQLSIHSGLSVVSVGKLLPELIKKGEIIELEELSKTGGRRASLFDYKPAYQLLLVLQLIERNQKMVGVVMICDLLGNCVFEETFNENLLSWTGIKSIFKRFINDYPAICGICLGVPGSEIQGKLQIMDFPPLLDLNLSKMISEEFNLPTIIENDINVAVFGHYTSLKLTEETLVGIYYPEFFPPGAGIVINGQIHKGVNGFSGEIKYLPLNIDWSKFPRLNFDHLEHLKDIIQVMISVYDPNQIIIYRNDLNISPKELNRIKSSLQEYLPKINFPNLILTNDFETDYRNGLVSAGLKMISNYNKEMEKLLND